MPFIEPPIASPGPWLPAPATQQRNPFSYPAWDLVNATPIDTLPYQAVQFGAPLNQPGSWSGSLPLADPRIQQSFDWERATQTTTTALFVDLLGTLVWGGIIWTNSYDDADKTQSLKVTATEFGSYFQQRTQRYDYGTTFAAGEDPMLIAQQVCEDALGAGTIFGGITLTLNSPYSPPSNGVQITPSYPATSLQTIDSIVSILSQMGYGGGFDYTFDCAYVPGTRTPAVTMNFWYPLKGRRAAQSNLVLLSKDCTFTYPVDGTQRATSITETGSGVGTVQPATAAAAPGQFPDVPLLQRTFARSQINDDGTLAAVTASDEFLHAWPDVSPTFTVPLTLPDATGKIPPTAPLTLGSFDRGDNFIFRVDPVSGGGENTNPRFPNGCSFEFRINAWQCNLADKGLSTIVLTAGIPPGVFPPPLPPGT